MLYIFRLVERVFLRRTNTVGNWRNSSVANFPKLSSFRSLPPDLWEQITLARPRRYEASYTC